MSAEVILYGRPGCHLCDEAEAKLRELAPNARINVVNIEDDEELHSRFLETIPVIFVGGEQLAKLVQYRRPSFAQKLAEQLSG